MLDHFLIESKKVNETESAVFDVLKLCSHKRDAEFVIGIENFLGKEILPQDATRVQFHPLRPFYKGEIVAWRSQNGEKLKYGRVPENVRSSAGQALYRFMVEISSGITEPLLSSNIFSFRSILFSDVSSASMPEDNLRVIDRINAESSGGRSMPSQQQPMQDLQHGRVSAAELVQAVHEMLSSAGINMDVERQSLLQTTLTLQDQLEESQAALLLEQEKSDMATKEADTAKAAWSCRVWLNNEVDVTIVPCGHVLCRRCSSAVSRCPFCRIQVSKIMRIFRP